MTKKRIQVDEAQQFLLRHMDTMIAIYKLFMEREVTPRDGHLMLKVMASIEEHDPDDDDQFLRAVKLVLAQEKEKLQ